MESAIDATQASRVASSDRTDVIVGEWLHAGHTEEDILKFLTVPPCSAFTFSSTSSGRRSFQSWQMGGDRPYYLWDIIKG